MRFHEATRGVEAAVQVHGTEHRFHEVREDALRVQRPLLQALAHVQTGHQVQGTGYIREGAAAHQVGPGLGEPALLDLRLHAEQLLRHEKAQDRISQELQPLVVSIGSIAGGGVAQGAVELREVVKIVADPTSQRLQCLEAGLVLLGHGAWQVVVAGSA